MENDYIEKLKLNPVISHINDVEGNILKICQRTGLDYNNDIAIAFGDHYQNVIHAVNIINDFSYDGLINHLKKGLFGKIFLKFNLILNYITDIINVKLHRVEYDNLLNVLTRYLFTTISILVVLYFVVNSLVIIIFIWQLKKLCQQIILLKQVFQLREVIEQ